MKKMTLLVFICMLSTGVFAQMPANRFGPKTKDKMIGFYFNSVDFITPVSWSNSNASRRIASPEDFDFGFSLAYWKGLQPKLDLSVKFNGLMHDYAGDRNEATSSTETGLELEGAINARALPNDNFFSPFLTAGLGLGLYTGDFGSYVPVGLGLQFNFGGATSIMLQTNYRFTLTPEVLDDNIMYSMGFLVNLKQDD